MRGGWVSPPLAAALLAAVLFSQTLVAMVPAEAKKKLPLLFNSAVRAYDDLNLAKITGDDDIFVLNHFGAERVGQAENIKFSDKIIRASDLPLS